eukprot:GHVH01015606.1.p1 GENE.GHVH01015606.1~~GHVH01015606.1.p1  ORF type:complete len:337 (+),score=32.84 GHVH01015606.1:887-1897(+)
MALRWFSQVLRIPFGLETIVELLSTTKDDRLINGVVLAVSQLLMQGDHILINLVLLGVRELERTKTRSGCIPFIQVVDTFASENYASSVELLTENPISRICASQGISKSQPQAILTMALFSCNFGIIMTSKRGLHEAIHALDTIIDSMLDIMLNGLLADMPARGMDRVRQAVLQIVLSDRESTELDGHQVSLEVDRIVEALEANELRDELLKEYIGSPKTSKQLSVYPIRLAPSIISTVLIHFSHHFLRKIRQSNPRTACQNFISRTISKVDEFIKTYLGEESKSIVDLVFQEFAEVVDLSDSDITSDAIQELMRGHEIHGDDVPTDELPPLPDDL